MLKGPPRGSGGPARASAHAARARAAASKIAGAHLSHPDRMVFNPHAPPDGGQACACDRGVVDRDVDL
jgi:hypothetical protein